MNKHANIKQQAVGGTQGRQSRRAMRHQIASVLLGTVLTVGASGFAAAQTPTGTSDSWQFELMPYLWMAGMQGSVQAGRLPSTNVNESFSDLLSYLDVGGMGMVEARKDRWGLLFDAEYMKLSDSVGASKTGPGGNTLTVNADATIKFTMMTAGGAYRVMEDKTMPVDVIVGGRYTKLSEDTSLNASLPGFAKGVSLSGDVSWTDPFIGVRVQYRIDDRLGMLGYVDVGGSNSMQAVVGGSYAWSKTASGQFGYRYYKVDHEDGNFIFDVTMEGPYLGAKFVF